MHKSNLISALSRLSQLLLQLLYEFLHLITTTICLLEKLTLASVVVLQLSEC